MKPFLLNIFLALVWASLIGRITLTGLLVGFLGGYLLLWWLRRLFGPTTYFQKMPKTLSFLLFFIIDLLHSNFRVAREVLTFRPLRRPGIIGVPLDVTSDFEITLLTNLITLTPGVMGVDVSSDKKVLYIHSMFMTSADEVRHDIKSQYERRVMELFQ